MSEFLEIAAGIGKKYQGTKSSLIPVWGTQADIAAAGSADVPSLGNIARKLRSDERVSADCRADIDSLVEVGDFVTAISLAALEIDDFHIAIEDYFHEDWKTNVVSEIEDLYHIFASVGFARVASSDVGEVLEIVFRGEDQLKPDDRNYVERAAKPIENKINRTRIVRLNSTWDRSPLLTWQDVVEGYRIPQQAVNEIQSNLMEEAEQSGFPKHAELIKKVFDKLQVEIETEFDSSGEVFHRWFKDVNFLMIGVSPYEPIFQLLMRAMDRLDRFKDHEHFLLPPPDSTNIRDYTDIQTVRLDKWDDLSPFFEQIAVEFYAKTKGGRGKDKFGRQNNFPQERFFYGDPTKPDISGSPAVNWLQCDSKSLIPFVELWDNEKNLPPEQAIKISISETQKFSLPDDIAAIRQEYWDYRKKIRRDVNSSERQINEIKIRVNESSSLPDGSIQLDVEPVEYRDFLATNHFVQSFDQDALNPIEKMHPSWPKEFASLTRMPTARILNPGHASAVRPKLLR